jgi:hypothetical protein
MAIINILYLIIFLMFIFSGIFILYHIFCYSYSKTAMLFMVLIFSTVMSILLILNFLLFNSINFSDIISLLT